MRDYSKGYIYKVVPKDNPDTLLYIGYSTQEKLSRVYECFRWASKTGSKDLFYYIQTIGGVKNIELIILEYPKYQYRNDYYKRIATLNDDLNPKFIVER